LGHLTSQCHEKKEGKDKDNLVAASTTVEDFTEEFEKEFSLVTLVSIVESSEFVQDNRWVIDSGASH